MDIDYNKLKSFLAVIECGSVTAAAKILHRTQSAVSQTLNNLEKNLGLTLIEWEGKQLRLTRDGQLVYKAINDRMTAMNEQLTAIIKSGVEVGGCIEVGVLQDDSTRIQDDLLDMITQFRRRYPTVSFKIKFGTSIEIEQSLLDRKLDIGLLINFRERHRFHVFKVATEEHIIVTSAKYSEQSGPFNRLNNVITADLIDIDETFTCLTPWIQKHDPKLIEELDKNNPVIIVPDFRAVKKLILLGQGIGVIPRYLIENELAAGQLVQVLPKLSTLQVSVDCAFERGRRERLCERIFIESLREDKSVE